MQTGIESVNQQYQAAVPETMSLLLLCASQKRVVPLCQPALDRNTPEYVELAQDPIGIVLRQRLQVAQVIVRKSAHRLGFNPIRQLRRQVSGLLMRHLCWSG